MVQGPLIALKSLNTVSLVLENETFENARVQKAASSRVLMSGNAV